MPQQRLTAFAATLLLLLAGCPSWKSSQVGPAESGPEETPIPQLVADTLEDNLRDRQLSSQTHGAWQIMHGLLAYGNRLTIDTPAGTRPALEYLIEGGTVDGFNPRRGDVGIKMDLEPESKRGQGHRDQWLAVLSQCGLRPTTRFSSGEIEFALSDWLKQAKYDTPNNIEGEFSWTLVALSQLAESDSRWSAGDGYEYSVESLLAAEVQQADENLAGGVCGGTHRMIGISMALQRREQEGKAINGTWADAQRAVDSALELARQNQNPDGSYSTAYFHRTGWNRDLGESLGSTGHVLEFIATAAPAQTLREPWVERSVRCVCRMLDQCRDVDLECGVLYHALHGLAVYQQRISDGDS